MPKYTEEELFELRDHAAAPADVDLVAFSAMIAEVKDKLEKRYETQDSAEGKFGFARRRSSRHDARPHFKKNFHKKHENVQTDADGWVTFKNNKKSFGAGTGEESRDEFRESVKQAGAKESGNAAATLLKVKPNTKGIGTRAAADTKEAIAEKKSKAFNAFSAFSALGSDDEESEEESSEEENDDEE